MRAFQTNLHHLRFPNQKQTDSGHLEALVKDQKFKDFQLETCSKVCFHTKFTLLLLSNLMMFDLTSSSCVEKDLFKWFGWIEINFTWTCFKSPSWLHFDWWTDWSIDPLDPRIKKVYLFSPVFVSIVVREAKACSFKRAIDVQSKEEGANESEWVSKSRSWARFVCSFACVMISWFHFDDLNVSLVFPINWSGRVGSVG